MHLKKWMSGFPSILDHQPSLLCSLILTMPMIYTLTLGQVNDKVLFKLVAIEWILWQGKPPARKQYLYGKCLGALL